MPDPQGSQAPESDTSPSLGTGSSPGPFPDTVSSTGAHEGREGSPGRQPGAGGRRPWAVLAALTVVAVGFHVFMEWLFFVTKPSFLSTLPTADKLLLPGTAAFPLLAAGLLLVALLGLLAAASGRAAGPDDPAGGRRLRAGPARWLAVARVLPAAVLALTALLLLDNFTHTLFRFSLETFAGPARHLYVAVLALLAFLAYRLVVGWQAALGRHPAARRILFVTTAALLAFSLAALLLQREPVRPLTARDLTLRPDSATRRPNILILGSDGLDANHLSLYGYHRRTTPFLERFAREALVCERAFPNAANTGGAVGSLLSGRLPIETGLIYPPDILRGEASYRHLPAALRRLGYRNAEVSVRWYADAVDLNMRDSFDQANSRYVGNPRADRLLAGLGRSGGYFLARMGERVWERFVHVFTRRPWSDPYREVTTQRNIAKTDGDRLRALYSFVESASGPWFAHVHLLGTHGSRFYPDERYFSRGAVQDGDWKLDFYDDAIVDFDRHLGEVVRFLAGRGELERTVLVVYSDHNMSFISSKRVPLLLRFPNREHAGRLAAVAQNLDVAPTLLDYLGVERPGWMGGRSLLDPGLDPCRPVVSAGSDPSHHVEQGGWYLSVPRPPFYTLGTLTLVAGDRVFNLDVATGRLDHAPADLPPGGAGRCPTPDPAAARAFLVDRLRTAGYDVSSLDVPATSPIAVLPGISCDPLSLRLTDLSISGLREGKFLPI